MSEIYNNWARYYDEIYSWKDYASEAVRIDEIVQQRIRSGGHELLEVACGTGKYIEHLKDKYHITGVDINPAMLEVARAKFPEMEFHEADMLDMDLGKQFDVVACLFSSIAYVKSYENLEKSIKNFYNHLKPGGVVIIEPFLEPDKYVEGVPHATFVDKPNLKIARMNTSIREGDTAILDLHFMVADKDGVKEFAEHHEMGLFDIERVKQMMSATGLEAEYTADGLMSDRGLYIGTKPIS